MENVNKYYHRPAQAAFDAPIKRNSGLRKSNNVARKFGGKRNSGLGVFFAGIAVLSTVVASGSLYIYQVTSSAIGGYDSTSLERRASELKEEVKNLELKTAELQSLKTIEEGAKKMKLEPSNQMIFTSPILKGTVAYSGGAWKNQN